MRPARHLHVLNLLHSYIHAFHFHMAAVHNSWVQPFVAERGTWHLT